MSDYVKRRAAALGVDPTGLIKTPEQKEAEAQQRMQQQLMMQGTPQMIKHLGQTAQKGMEADG